MEKKSDIPSRRKKRLLDSPFDNNGEARDSIKETEKIIPTHIEDQTQKHECKKLPDRPILGKENSKSHSIMNHCFLSAKKPPGSRKKLRTTNMISNPNAMLCTPTSPPTSPQFSSPSNILALKILTSSTGLSSAPVFTNPILLTTPIPLVTRPKIVCFPSSHGVGASVMKN